jgi:hypothetical protein
VALSLALVRGLLAGAPSAPASLGLLLVGSVGAFGAPIGARGALLWRVVRLERRRRSAARRAACRAAGLIRAHLQRAAARAKRSLQPLRGRGRRRVANF